MTSMMESSSSQPDVSRRTTTKMASMTAVSVFLLCCSAVASQDCHQFAATGRSFNVPLGCKWDNNGKLKWKFKDIIIFDKRPEKVTTGKIEDINADGSLKLTNVTKDQEGLYIPEVYDQDGKSQPTKSIKLCVLDPVKKPKVETTCEDESVIITCIPGQQPKDVEYEWLQNDAKMEKEKSLSFKVKAAETKADKFACNVSNKASSEVSEAVTHNCTKTGIPGLPDELPGIWPSQDGGGDNRESTVLDLYWWRSFILLLVIIVIIVLKIKGKRRNS